MNNVRESLARTFSPKISIMQERDHCRALKNYSVSTLFENAALRKTVVIPLNATKEVPKVLEYQNSARYDSAATLARK